MFWMYSMLVALVLPLSEGLRCYQTDTTSQGVAWDTERMCPRYSLYLCAFLYAQACLCRPFVIFCEISIICIQTQRTAVASRRATNLATRALLPLLRRKLRCYLAAQHFSSCSSMCGVMVASFIAYSFLSFILLFVAVSNKGKHEVSSQNRKISGVNEKRCVLLPVKKVRLRKM
jgi:hypothetical protein